MPPEQWIVLMALGGLAGALGQLGRVVVGLKKVGEEAAAAGKSANDLVEPARLVMSIAIGFTAGALAALLASDANAKDVGFKQVLAFAGAGYVGADFIEGAIRSVVPSSTGSMPAVNGEAASGDGYVG